MGISARCAVALFTAIAMLAGCGGTQTGIGGAMPQGSAFTAQGRAHGASSSSGDLLYVTTTNAIVVVSYPNWQIVTTIPGSWADSFPCSDPNNGNVFVPGIYTGKVVEFAHGGTTPIATLSIPAPYTMAYACSVDPTTDNLAVTSDETSLKHSAIVVYPQGSGTPTVYKNGFITSVIFPAYDDVGNLFSTAFTKSGFRIVELPARKKTFRVLRISPDVAIAHLQWDGRYLADVTWNGEHGGSTINQIQPSGRVATIVHSSTLYRGAENDAFCLGGGSLIGFFGRIKPGNDQAVAAWSYPSGGYQKSKHFGITKGRGDAVSGLTLSVQPSR